MEAGIVLGADLLPALAAGLFIGLTLALVGGGGSILAVPLLVYVVGVQSPHQAIGTAAMAVALNALFGLFTHARAGTVKWRCGVVFAASGVVGAAAGAELGKSVDGQRLLALFGLLMIGVGLSMLRDRRTASAADVRLSRETAAQLLPRLVPIGLGVGLLAGFFGIGGGFLIVPGLILATAMPMLYAVGTSLVGVFAFGLTTAASYAVSNLVDWRLTALLLAGGAVGAWLGFKGHQWLASRKRLLERGFALLVVATGSYVIARAAG